jgi:hypothetical protein
VAACAVAVELVELAELVLPVAAGLLDAALVLLLLLPPHAAREHATTRDIATQGRRARIGGLR